MSVTTAVQTAQQTYRQHTSKTPNSVTMAISDQFIGLVVAAVVLIIGLLVFAEVEAAMPDIEQQGLSDARDAVANNTGTAFELGAVALIIVAAVVILALITGWQMGGRRGGRLR